MKCGDFRGFTLLELLVAIAIFSIMAAMAYGGLRALMSGRQHTDQVAQRLQEIQRALLFLQQDLSQIVQRPVRDEFGEIESAVSTGTGGSEDLILQLTRGGIGTTWSGRPSLRRITYQINSQQLIRSVWPVLDRVQGSEPRQFNLTNNLEHLEFRFLSRTHSSDWVSTWPKPGEKAAESAVPRAIEVKLQVTGLGEVTRLFVVGS